MGALAEQVTVSSSSEIVQTQSATVASTINTNQITKLPLTSRSAMDFVNYLPGVTTANGNRQAVINGLPRGTINITLDGINVQDNNGKSGDGFYTYVRPRLDAVQEVTVSTGTAGADNTGEGAVQVKFITRSGGNELHGSLYEYHRNPALNSNYWFNNRDKTPTYNGTTTPCTTEQMQTEFEKCKAPRDRVLFNQFGGRIGGPMAGQFVFGHFAHGTTYLFSAGVFVLAWLILQVTRSRIAAGTVVARS